MHSVETTFNVCSNTPMKTIPLSANECPYGNGSLPAGVFAYNWSETFSTVRFNGELAFQDFPCNQGDVRDTVFDQHKDRAFLRNDR